MLILTLTSSYRVRHGACLLSIKKLIFGTFDFVLLQPFSCCVVSSSLVLQNHSLFIRSILIALASQHLLIKHVFNFLPDSFAQRCIGCWLSLNALMRVDTLEVSITPCEYWTQRREKVWIATSSLLRSQSHLLIIWTESESSFVIVLALFLAKATNCVLFSPKEFVFERLNTLHTSLAFYSSIKPNTKLATTSNLLVIRSGKISWSFSSGVKKTM